MATAQRDLFLQLVRLGIGTVNSSRFTIHGSDSVDWIVLKELADRQGLSAIVLDGLNAVHGEGLMVNGSLPLELKLEWIGEVLQNYEARYRQYEKAIGSLAGWYNQHGFKMMVLKGYSCSLDWPISEHRTCGDIDIWLFGQQAAADKELSSWLKVNGSWSGIDTSHHHHSVFDWDGFTVENHYDFINVHHHKSHVKMEATLKKLGQDDTHFVEVSGECVYLPSPNLHALFLLKHTMLHFVSGEITLRQLLDWGFFVKMHGKDVDWNWLDRILEKNGMKPLFQLFNAICVEDIGFNKSLFPVFEVESKLKERVLNDILSPEFSETEPKKFLPRIFFKYRRWRSSAWKHELCYREGMWSAFWSGVWAKMLKPKTI